MVNRPHYNIAPTQRVFVIRGERQGASMQWGLIPSWAKDEKIGASLINASFRSAIKRRRCLAQVRRLHH
jgi:putative SOS response-associated peptidase YedK